MTATPPHLIIMAKRPDPGQTKTRLCPPLTPALAAELYAGILRDTLDLARRTPGIRPVVAYAPDDAGGYFADLAPNLARVPQQGANLGERLANATTMALSAGAPAVVAMSSDSPSLPPAYLARAFAFLAAGADLVFGPAEDGGYYLAGLRRPAPRLFHDVPMSTPTVLRDSLAIAAELGLNVNLLPPWYDVDTIADLRRLHADPAPLRHTRPILERILEYV
jgi:rSAM/selenodomain-associated transferase 1